jgi:hypothetical protein
MGLRWIKMMEFKANSFSMLDPSNGEVFYKSDNISDMVVDTYIDSSSLSQETLSLSREATFSAELVDCSPLLTYETNIFDKPFYVEYNIPIMVQARWHKKPRINKKWLKRYGMKKDNILVRCNVESLYPNTQYDPLYMTEHVEYGMTLSNMEYKFRPDQLRRNLKLEDYHG